MQIKSGRTVPLKIICCTPVSAEGKRLVNVYQCLADPLLVAVTLRSLTEKSWVLIADLQMTTSHSDTAKTLSSSTWKLSPGIFFKNIIILIINKRSFTRYITPPPPPHAVRPLPNLSRYFSFFLLTLSCNGVTVPLNQRPFAQFSCLF